jgi:hypothetical protein
MPVCGFQEKRATPENPESDSGFNAGYFVNLE